ncbi:MAG: RluA family pseudouridine synthase [Candidatus Paceibacteria bacterium]
MNNDKETFVPTIIYEDGDVLVIDKPHGMLVHEDGFAPHEGTVVAWFLDRAPTARGVGEVTLSPKGVVLERSGVVHRLDRDTSGVMVLAKTPEAHAHLKEQFHDRLAKKEYRALVYGKVTDKWGTIDRPIGRSARDFRLRSAEQGARGTLRDAVTHYECLKYGEYKGENFSYLSLKPKTGRTHQLRVHLKAIDRPIVGDALYAGKKLEQSSNLELTRLALHAYNLELTLLNGQKTIFTAPMPAYLEEASNRLAEN